MTAAAPTLFDLDRVPMCEPARERCGRPLLRLRSTTVCGELACVLPPRHGGAHRYQLTERPRVTVPVVVVGGVI